MQTRPLLCRIGFHRWVDQASNAVYTKSRCTRPGCHRSRLQFFACPWDRQEWDQILCSCGVEITPARGDGAFWRNVNTGEVCSGNHWHEPAR